MSNNKLQSVVNSFEYIIKQRVLYKIKQNPRDTLTCKEIYRYLKSFRNQIKEETK